MTNNHNDDFETNDSHPGSFLAGVVLGGLIGAGTMLLLAPQSGEKTRTQIQLKGNELRDQATEAVETGMSKTRAKAHQLTEDVYEKAKEMQHTGEDMIVEQKSRLSAAIAAGKTAIPVS